MMFLLLVLGICGFLTCPVGAKWTLRHDQFDCEGGRTVYWFLALNGTSVVHFVFAADRHVRPPALIILHSAFQQSKVHVDCKKYSVNSTFRGSLTVDAVTASYGVMLYELCDYIDINDKVTVPSAAECQHYFGSNLDWKLESSSLQDRSKLSVVFRGERLNDSHDLFFDDGGFFVEFTIFDTDTQPLGDYYYKVPGGLGVAITLTVNRLRVVKANTRVAPILLLFSNRSMEDNDDFVQLTGYASDVADGPGGKLPSTYLLLDQRVKDGQTDEHEFPGAYAHFSPVSWTASNRDKSSMRLANVGQRMVFSHKGSPHKFTSSLVYAYYANRFNPIHQGSHVGFVAIREQFVNLGSAGDGFYAASNYTSWTMVLSLGSPSVESANSNVGRNAMIAIGILSVVAACGGGYAYHRRRQRTRQSSRIFRFESMENAAFHARLSPQPTDDTQPSDPPIMTSVEPFQSRKFQLTSWLRNRTGGPSRQPLLMDQPPDYHSVVSTDR